MSATRVDSLAAFVSEVSRIQDAWTKHGEFFELWFRGQSNASWPLVPSLLRSKIADMEGEMRTEFIRRGAQLIGGRAPENDWEWYFLMQHHRAPTRLLDWTDGSLIALFFALNSNAPETTRVAVDPGVWVLDPWWLNRRVLDLDSIVLTDWKEANAYLPPPVPGIVRRKLPIAIAPVWSYPDPVDSLYYAASWTELTSSNCAGVM
jgi:hypothetical protein